MGLLFKLRPTWGLLAVLVPNYMEERHLKINKINEHSPLLIVTHGAVLDQLVSRRWSEKFTASGCSEDDI